MYNIYWSEEKAYYTETVGDTDNFVLEPEYAHVYGTEAEAQAVLRERNLDDCVVIERS